MPTAVEEMIRWSTPVKEFMRTAAEDTTVRGVPIAKGESVYLAYVSGNRDEEVFDEPFRFTMQQGSEAALFRVAREWERAAGSGTGCISASAPRWHGWR